MLSERGFIRQVVGINDIVDYIKNSGILDEYTKICKDCGESFDEKIDGGIYFDKIGYTCRACCSFIAAEERSFEE